MNVVSIFTSQKENQQAWLREKKEEALRKFKDEWPAREMILTAFWDCPGLVYAEFGPDACKEK